MKTLPALLCFVLTTHVSVANAQAPQSEAFPRPAKIRISDTKVAAEVSDCADWLRQLKTLPLNHKWAEFKSSVPVPEKNEFETTLEYNSRLDSFHQQFEPTWVNLAFNVNPDALTYDADSGELSIHYTSARAGLDGTFSEKRDAYTGVNAFGVTASVRKLSLRSTGAVFEPTNTALPVNKKVSIAPAEARNLKERGRVHVLGILSGTDGTGGFSRATLDSPTDVSVGERILHVRPICVATTVDGAQAPGWQYTSSPATFTEVTPPRPRAASLQRALEDFPTIAGMDGLKGKVGVRLSVSELGRVTQCAIIATSGNPALDEAACSKLTRNARFEPASQYGRPIAGEFQTSLTYSFPS